MTNVSIGIPFTDQGEELSQAIRSVLCQTHNKFELILFGDGPNPASVEIIKKFDDSRIRLYQTQKRRGLAATLNEIARLAQYPLLARMDADDIMHPERIARQKSAFDADTRLDVLGTHAYLIDASSKLVGAFNESQLPETGGGFLKSNAFSHPTVMARTDWFLANPYDEGLLRGQDKELWLRTWHDSKFRKLEDRLMFYRSPRDVSASRLRRNEAYNRRIIKAYAGLETSPLSKSGRLALSYAKEGVLGLANHSLVSRRLYDRKWAPLEPSEFTEANQVLQRVVNPPVTESPAGKVVAVTVTYGSRNALVERTVSAAIRSGVSQVIIVDNGSTATARSAIQRLGASDQRIRIVTIPVNEGSAPGFATGILEFLTSDGTHMWLLDDDNECEQDSLRHLMSSLKAVEMLRPDAPTGAFALRAGNAKQQAVAAGASIKSTYPQPGSFMYFDIVQFVKNKISSKISINDRTESDSIGIPYGPYGGLLMSRSSVVKVGLPKVDLGLYEDDTEFTSRVPKLGGALVLSASAKIHDIDEKWSQTNGAKGLLGLLLANDGQRTYFAVRNRVNFDRSQITQKLDLARFYLNRYVFASYVKILSLKHQRAGQASEIDRAIRDGLNRDLSRRFSPSDRE